MLRAYWWAGGLALSVGVIALAARFSSSSPDGLQRVAKDEGFADSAKGSPLDWLPAYTVPGLSGDLSRVTAGLVGILIVVAAITVVGRLMLRRNR